MNQTLTYVGRLFLSTPSARRATTTEPDLTTISFDFYPRPPRGGRRQAVSLPHAPTNFYPRPPRGGRPMRELTGQVAELDISIHALREEGDHGRRLRPRSSLNFYPRPPRGGRLILGSLGFLGFLFLSTPSARRATPSRKAEDMTNAISIHALREEGDKGQDAVHVPGAISIHALREEGDKDHQAVETQLEYFYPRPPRGGRQQKQRQNLYFQTNYTTFCTNLEEP